MNTREQQFADMILRMIDHGERCNWFADRGDNELVMEARALANNEAIHTCNSNDCSWRGPVSDTVHPKHEPQCLLCPECGETTEEE